MAAAATQPWTAAETVATAPLAQAPVAVPAEHPAGDPLGAPDPLGPPDPLEALEKAAAEVATPAAPSPTWPCPQCGAKVAMDLDFCNECGAGFLAGVANGQSVRLPVIGEVKSMSSSQRLMMGVGVALALMALIVALAFIGGHLFG